MSPAAFTDQTGVAVSTLTTSNIVQSIPCSQSVSISGGGSPQFEICSNATCGTVVHTWGTASQTMTSGQYLQLRLTSSASNSTTNTATLTMGGTNYTWNVTTIDPPKTVFVTSTTYTGSLGGVSGANSKCATQATAGGLSGTYKAWIAVTAGVDDPATTFTHPNGPYNLVGGTTIANGWAGLTSGTLLASISKDETGATVAVTHAWSNVWIDGGAKSGGSDNSNNCTGWTSANSGRFGEGGDTDQTGNYWADGVNTTCNNSYRLYCFQQ